MLIAIRVCGQIIIEVFGHIYLFELFYVSVNVYNLMVLWQSPEALDTIILFAKEEGLLARQLLLMVLIVSSELVLTGPWWEQLQKY